MTEQPFKPGGLVSPAHPVLVHVAEGEPFLKLEQASDWLAGQGLTEDQIRSFRLCSDDHGVEASNDL